MKMLPIWLNHQPVPPTNLPSLSNPPTAFNQSNPSNHGCSALFQHFQCLENWFIPRSEPHIRETVDGTGNVWWQVYDPQIDQTLWFESEREMMNWLDSRYYY